MIVVDSNVIAYLFLTSDRSIEAEKALQRDPDWTAPLLWRSEFRSVLAHYLRKGLLDVRASLQIMEQAADLMRGREYNVTSQQALELVASSDCSAYDCEFVSLAHDLAVSLVTADRHLLNQFPNTAISLTVFAKG